MATYCSHHRLLAPEFAFNLSDEQFDHVIWGQELFSDRGSSWMFRHDVVEVCTAVKGRAMEAILEMGADKVVYLDPDIALFGDLDAIVSSLDRHDIVLTPHQVEPEKNDMAIKDNELASLQYGVFNLGFVAINSSENARQFARWWSKRLEDYCYDDLDVGLFTDQKWCNMVPAFFDNVLVWRDPGCNVASWNLSTRFVEIQRDGSVLVNGETLRFYHFTKLGPVGEAMTRRYAQGRTDVFEIWAWYMRQEEKFRSALIPTRWWHFGTYDDGTPIAKADRVMYRARKDLQDAFPEPFSTGAGTYSEWLSMQQPTSN